MEPWYGMSLRDWFAGQILTGIMADSDASFGSTWRNSATGEERTFGEYNKSPGEGWELVRSADDNLAAFVWSKADAVLRWRDHAS